MHDPSAVTTYLFTDIEGSTGHWEREPQRMVAALAQHDAIAHAQVTAHGGTVVKTTGDGIHAVFADPLGAVRAAVALQLALADADATGGIQLRVRCGLHAGVDARRDNDYYGNAINRAARVMSAANGGQILVSRVVATLVADRLPQDISLLDLGQVRLRGLAQPEQVCQVVHPSLPRQFPGVARARGDAEQPAATADVVRRPRARTRRSRAAARRDAAADAAGRRRLRQDAPLAAGSGGRARRLSGRRVARRTRARRRSAAGAAGGRVGAGREGRPGISGGGRAAEVRARAALPAGARQLRARRARVRRTRAAVAGSRARRDDPRVEPRGVAHPRRDARIRSRR